MDGTVQGAHMSGSGDQFMKARFVVPVSTGDADWPFPDAPASCGHAAAVHVWRWHPNRKQWLCESCHNQREET